MRARLRQEDGIALVMAMAFTVVLSILVFGMVSYVTSNENGAQNSSDNVKARSYAESALDTAYSVINWANQLSQIQAGKSPSKPNLLGCIASASSSTVSDCSSPTPLCIKFTASSCPSPYVPTAGTAVVYGFYPGTSVDPTNPPSFQGVTEAASTWILVAKGYAVNPAGHLAAATLKGTVQITAGGSGAVAAVWNHVFLTAPLSSSTVCTQTLDANSLVWDAPLYVIGNLCLNGNGVTIKEQGAPIDLQVGGKLVLAGNGSSQAAVGDWSTSPATGITSGVVVGNCASSITSSTTSACGGGLWHYKANNSESFVTQSDPELSDSTIESNYTTFDPGPNHACVSATTPVASLATSRFDSTRTAGEGSSGPMLPDDSGSGTNGTAFDLTPSTGYQCVSSSANGTATGYLIWNPSGSSITVSGITVPAGYLAINGSIFIDAPLNITQSFTYAGTGEIMAAGQITFLNNSMSICAQNTSCAYANWQGTTGHNDMLNLATVLKNNTKAIYFKGNSTTYMGSLWAPTSSAVYYEGSGPSTIGPLAAGSLTIANTANGYLFKPLPTIVNMPVGAPVPPNVSATVNPLHIIG